MIRAVKAVDEATLTPMAAVAGAVADLVKEYLSSSGEIDLLSVNNGGDISICNRSGRPMRIGIGDIGSTIPTPYVMKVEGHRLSSSGDERASAEEGPSALRNQGKIVAGPFRRPRRMPRPRSSPTRSSVGHRPGRAAKGAGVGPPLTDIPDELVTVDGGCLDTEGVSWPP